MLKRFEEFSAAITGIYQYILKIEQSVMAQYGLKGSHTQCLIELKNHPEGITFTKLCESCGKDKAAVSRAITSLESKGLIQREKSTKGSNYRANLVLTEEGRNAAKIISEETAKAANRASADLPGPQRDAFYRNLQLVASNLAKFYDDEEDED